MAAIRERRYYADWTDRQWLIWSTRTISTFVAATVPVETKGDSHPLVDEAQKIGDGILPGTKRPEEPSTKEPRAGSFEAFMATFGRQHG